MVLVPALLVSILVSAAVPTVNAKINAASLVTRVCGLQPTAASTAKKYLPCAVCPRTFPRAMSTLMCIMVNVVTEFLCCVVKKLLKTVSNARQVLLLQFRL